MACAYCATRLMTRSCATCLGAYFRGNEFCPHCGAAAVEEQPGDALIGECPGCRRPLTFAVVGHVRIARCEACEGVWVRPATLERICAQQDLQATLLVAFPASAGHVFSREVRYRKCPQCHEMMSRRNFAHRSGVIVDVCRPHGVWLDKGELRAIVDFVRNGGLMKARAAEIEAQRRRLEESQYARTSLSDGADVE